MLKFEMASTYRLNIFRRNKMCIKTNGHILSITFLKKADVHFFLDFAKTKK